MLQTSTFLAVACYCMTHLSLLLLTYRASKNNQLLTVACVAVVISGLAYSVLIFCLVQGDFAMLTIVVALCLFFVKMGLTVAQVVLSLQADRREASAVKSSQ